MDIYYGIGIRGRIFSTIFVFCIALMKKLICEICRMSCFDFLIVIKSPIDPSCPNLA